MAITRIENLLVAGRCISATHEAASAVRGMSVCIVTGHAAGTAAALATAEGVSPRSLPLGLLQATLREQDAVLVRGEGFVQAGLRIPRPRSSLAGVDSPSTL